jgi:hypothetical protein
MAKKRGRLSTGGGLKSLSERATPREASHRHRLPLGSRSQILDVAPA